MSDEIIDNIPKIKKNNDIMHGSGEWDESKHPRDNDGKFANKAGVDMVKSKEKLVDTHENDLTSEAESSSIKLLSEVAIKAKFNTIYEASIKNEPAITNELQNIAKSLTGASMTGLENRLKTPESVLRKCFKDSIKPDKLYDIIRYTQQSEPEMLTTNAQKTLTSLINKGYKTVAVSNTWIYNDIAYKGVNVKMLSPNGQKFELQFHTTESFAKKQELHIFYEEQRLYKKGSPEHIRIENIMLGMTRNLIKPLNIEAIKEKKQKKEVISNVKKE